MIQFVLAPAARSDLIEIWTYYAVEVGDLDLADKIKEELFRAIRKVAENPGIGHLRRELAAEPVRFWRVRSFLIIYRDKADPLEVVRVLHGSRDVQAILRST